MEQVATPYTHILVSRIKTPADYIEKKGKVDYAKPEYMRYLANKYYPGWSWKIEREEIVRNANGEPQFFLVIGILTWPEKIITHPDLVSEEIHWRSGSMSAAHRIQYSERVDKETGEESYVLTDPGNDIKAANTDTIKKAWNFYLNICDDVYRYENPELSEEKEEEIMEIAKEIDEEEKYGLMIANLEINTENFYKRLDFAKFRRSKQTNK